MTYYNTNNDFATILENCIEYIWSGEDSDKITRGYMKELTDVIIMDKKDRTRAWEMLCNSGIFHDCEGKVTSFNNEKVTTTLDY